MGETSQSRSLYILDLANHRVKTIPGSEGLFSPRWSPDGRFIAALSLDMTRLMLYDTTAQTWRILAQHSVADPVWAHDSRFIFFHDYVQKNQTMYRIAVPDGTIQQVADLQDIEYADAVDYQFAGLTPDDTPLVSARMSTANIYSAQLPK
jgi:Tol biopolymer transport system component